MFLKYCYKLFLPILFICTIDFPHYLINDNLILKKTIISFYIFIVLVGLFFSKKVKCTVPIFLFIALILYQLLSLSWSFLPNTSWISIFNNAFLLGLLVVFSQEETNLSKKNIARVSLLVNILIVLFLTIFWLDCYFKNGMISELDTLKLKNVFGKNANPLSALFAMFFPLYLFVFREKGLNRKLLFSLISLHLLILLLFNSRASLIAVLFCICYIVSSKMIPSKFKKQIAKSTLISIALLFLFYFGFNLELYFYNLNPLNFAGERLEVWQKTFLLLQNNPLFGIGSNNWYFLYPSTDLGDLRFQFDSTVTHRHAHNLYLQYLVELGIVGFIIFLTFLLSPLYYYYKSLHKERDLPYLLMFFVFLIVAFFYGNIYLEIKSFKGVEMLAFFAIAKLTTQDDSEEKSSFYINKIFLLIPVLVCVYNSFSTFQHNKFGKYLEFKKQQEFTKAMEYLKSARWPIFFEYYNNISLNHYLGNLYKSEEQNELAISSFQQAILEQPNNLETCVELMDLYFESGDLVKSRTMADKVISLKKNIVNAHLMGAKIALQQGDFKAYKRYITYPKEIVHKMFNSGYQDIEKTPELKNIDIFWRKFKKYKNRVEQLEKKYSDLSLQN